MDLTTQTPAEVDVPLAVLYDQINDLRFDLYNLEDEAERINKRQAQREAGTFRGYQRPEDDERRLSNVHTKMVELQGQIAALIAETKPYQAEYTRRGGWTRAWLVDNTGGHVHRSMDCTTCFERTRFGWLPQVSGLTEEEIVGLAGESACTICYPSAPAEVLNNPSALELPRRREERLAREAEKAAKQAKKAEKSLSLDGSVVTVHWTYEATNWNDDVVKTRNASKDLKTYRAAELFVIGAMVDDGPVDYDKPTQVVVDAVVEMMATKKGLDPKDLAEALNAKAAMKRSRG